MNGIIELNNIKIYAYHGCLKEETILGSDYSIDVWVNGNFSEAIKTDQLKHTVDYVTINKIVTQEMKIPAKLLETVAAKILYRLKKEIPNFNTAKIKISKICPPINGNVEKVSVTLEI